MPLGGSAGSWLSGAERLLRGGNAAANPAAKRRRKGDDVLESLGGAAGFGLSGLGDAGAKRSGAVKAPAGGVRSTAGSNAKSAEHEALKKWLADEDAGDMAPECDADIVASGEGGSKIDAGAESAAKLGEASTPDVATAVGAVSNGGWRDLFSSARDCWKIDASTLRGLFWLSSKDLFFEWHQKEGILFQYFPSEADAPGTDPEQHPIWSSSCPDMHAEVWEELPLPPTDPAAAQAPEPAAAVPSAASEQEPEAEPASDVGLERPQGASPAEDSTSLTAMMPPPSCTIGKLRKRRSDPSSASSGAAASAEGEPTGQGEGATVLGCGPAPPSAVSVGAPRLPEYADDDEVLSSRPPILDSDDEGGDLADEDCSLPAAPADRAVPSAKDLDLDMFG